VVKGGDMTWKFRITYRRGKIGGITHRFINLGEPIPDLGGAWRVIAKGLYSGITDKAGQEICQGDRIEITNLDCQLQKAKLQGEVIFSNASFGVKITDVIEWERYNVEPYEVRWFLSMIDMTHHEIIGTIHEVKE